MELDKKLSRRQLVGTLALMSASIPLFKLNCALAADLPQVNSDDPMAQALGYVADASTIDASKTRTYKAGSHCAGCALYQGSAGAAFGPCATFPGRLVSKNGWCMAYAANG